MKLPAIEHLASIISMTHLHMDCFDVIGAHDDAPDDASIFVISRQGTWIEVNNSFIH